MKILSGSIVHVLFEKNLSERSYVDDDLEVREQSADEDEDMTVWSITYDEDDDDS